MATEMQVEGGKAPTEGLQAEDQLSTCQSTSASLFENLLRLNEAELTELPCYEMVCFAQVNHCSFSRGGELLLTGSDDCSARVWDVGNRKLLSKVTGHTGPVKACAFSADSTLFATGSCDCTVRVWNTKTGACLHILQGHNKMVETVCFSHDSKLIASGSWDYTANLWDPKSGRLVKSLSGHQNVIKTCAFSSDGQYLATGSWDYTVRVWHLNRMRQNLILHGHQGNVSCVAFSGIGMLASGSWDKTVRVWDSRKGHLIFLLTEHTGKVSALSFSLDAILLVTAAGDETVRVWDCEDGKCKKILKCELDLTFCCQFSPSNTLLTVGTSDYALTTGSTTAIVQEEVLEGNLIKHYEKFKTAGVLILANWWTRGILPIISRMQNRDKRSDTRLKAKLVNSLREEWDKYRVDGWDYVSILAKAEMKG
ncbi:WD repeat-containing protein 38-like [Carcharodon carcharias]|uniref:WD repeat-containing protein 38-like n=1 Tax=Carcharodon carcharias TaxID=13397 RepID=UPI001B7E8766|nr:WD repeat-containing protein 38-like [Carcharodon carcharias]